jgi:hypothetical protein
VNAAIICRPKRGYYWGGTCISQRDDEASDDSTVQAMFEIVHDRASSTGLFDPTSSILAFQS